MPRPVAGVTGVAAVLGGGLLCVWPIDNDVIDRDQLIAAALPDLASLAVAAGGQLLGSSTWRVIADADELEGWEHHYGGLLVATLPLATAIPHLRT
ncbi:MAG TPA: hypothetical protein VF657_09910 [Actinoplanes sp.]|jgi:hypothetical protein